MTWPAASPTRPMNCGGCRGGSRMPSPLASACRQPASTSRSCGPAASPVRESSRSGAGRAKSRRSCWSHRPGMLLCGPESPRHPDHQEALVMLDLGLNEKIAIITGGSDGLGRAAAEKLAAEGAKVAICGRRKEHLEQAAEEIKKATGGQVLAHAADVSRAADCERLVDAVVAQWGGVDILLNNAGTSAA